MKLSQKTIADRRDFIVQAVRANPTLTGDQLQELLFQHFGHRMGIGRLYAIKKQALKLDSFFDRRFSPHPPDPYDP